CLQVADAVVAGPGGEGIGEGQRGQRGEAAGTAATDRHARTVHPLLLGQVACSGGTVGHIQQPPVAVPPVPVAAAVTAASGVVHVQDGEASTGPELDPRVETGAHVPGVSTSYLSTPWIVVHCSDIG